MTGAAADSVPNVCAGPFGPFYSFHIERPWLMQRIGRAVWGIDSSILYESMEPIGRAAPGATIVAEAAERRVRRQALDHASFSAARASLSELRRAPEPGRAPAGRRPAPRVA